MASGNGGNNGAPAYRPEVWAYVDGAGVAHSGGMVAPMGSNGGGGPLPPGPSNNGSQYFQPTARNQSNGGETAFMASASASRAVVGDDRSYSGPPIQQQVQYQQVVYYDNEPPAFGTTNSNCGNNGSATTITVIEQDDGGGGGDTGGGFSMVAHPGEGGNGGGSGNQVQWFYDTASTSTPSPPPDCYYVSPQPNGSDGGTHNNINNGANCNAGGYYALQAGACDGAEGVYVYSNADGEAGAYGCCPTSSGGAAAAESLYNNNNNNNSAMQMLMPANGKTGSGASSAGDLAAIIELLLDDVREQRIRTECEIERRVRAEERSGAATAAGTTSALWPPASAPSSANTTPLVVAPVTPAGTPQPQTRPTLSSLFTPASATTTSRSARMPLGIMGGAAPPPAPQSSSSSTPPPPSTVGTSSGTLGSGGNTGGSAPKSGFNKALLWLIIPAIIAAILFGVWILWRIMGIDKRLRTLAPGTTEASTTLAGIAVPVATTAAATARPVPAVRPVTATTTTTTTNAASPVPVQANPSGVAFAALPVVPNVQPQQQQQQTVPACPPFIGNVQDAYVPAVPPVTAAAAATAVPQPSVVRAQQQAGGAPPPLLGMLAPNGNGAIGPGNVLQGPFAQQPANGGTLGVGNGWAGQNIVAVDSNGRYYTARPLV